MNFQDAGKNQLNPPHCAKNGALRAMNASIALSGTQRSCGCLVCIPFIFRHGLTNAGAIALSVPRPTSFPSGHEASRHAQVRGEARNQKLSIRSTYLIVIPTTGELSSSQKHAPSIFADAKDSTSTNRIPHSAIILGTPATPSGDVMRGLRRVSARLTASDEYVATSISFAICFTR